MTLPTTMLMVVMFLSGESAAKLTNIEECRELIGALNAGVPAFAVNEDSGHLNQVAYAVCIRAQDVKQLLLSEGA